MSNRGGRRRGSGRKPKVRTLVRKVTAEEVLGSIDEKALWRSLLKSKDQRIRLDAAKYLVDRRDGKAYQSIFTKGVIEHPVWREPDYIAAVNRAMGFNQDLIPIRSGSPGDVIEGDSLPPGEAQDPMDALPE